MNTGARKISNTHVQYTKKKCSNQRLTNHLPNDDFVFAFAVGLAVDIFPVWRAWFWQFVCEYINLTHLYERTGVDHYIDAHSC